MRHCNPLTQNRKYTLRGHRKMALLIYVLKQHDHTQFPVHDHAVLFQLPLQVSYTALIEHLAMFILCQFNDSNQWNPA